MMPSPQSKQPKAASGAPAVRNPVFRDEQLGFWSSHPYSRRQRLRLFKKIAGLSILGSSIIIPVVNIWVFGNVLAPLGIICGLVAVIVSPLFLTFVKTMSLCSAAADRQLNENLPGVPLDEIAASNNKASDGGIADSARDPATAPPWIKEVLTKGPEGKGSEENPWYPDVQYVVREMETQSLKFSNAATASNLDLLFGGRAPTGDQFEAFKRFVSAYDKYLAAPWEPVAADSPPSMMDFLIEGDAGSGRTTLLMACAAFAVMARGQHVLYLVSSETDEEKVKIRLGRLFSAMHMENYLTCGVLKARNLENWLSIPEKSQDGSEKKNELCLPSIVVASIANAEKCLYGSSFAGSMKTSQTRLLQILEVVIVDDFMSFGEVAKSHLPFFLDKHRLVLSAELAPMQLLVSSLKLSLTGSELLSSRLFSLKNFNRDTNLCRLKPPRPQGRIWEVSLRTRNDNPADEMDELVRACCAVDLNVVVFRKGLDADECQRQQKKLAERQEKGSVRVLADLDDATGVSLDAVFYQMAMVNGGIAITSFQLDAREWVLFKVLGRNEAEDRKDEAFGLVPLLFEWTAGPMMAAHLASAVRFIQPLTPIPMQAWHQFGLRAGEMAEDKRDESRGSGDQQASEEKDAAAPLVPAASSQAIAASGTQSPQSQDGQNIACLLLDDPPNPPGCWPYMVVKEGGENGSAEPVNVNEISRNLMSVKCSGKGDFFVIKALTGGDPLKHGRYARWVDRHEKDALVEYGVDLAYLREFKVRAPAGTFVAESVSRKGGDSLILLKAIRWRGRGDDCYLPILDIKWDVNETPELVARGGGTDWKIRWFDIDRRDKKNWQVTTIILGRANDYGWESPGDEKDLSFSYDAVLSLVQMGVPPHPEAPPELMDDKNRLEALISDRHWETGNPKSTAFCPELTAAFSYAFAKRMPEFSYYCRFLVFLLPDIIGENLIGEKSDYAPCKALAWIVEPATGGHVVMQGLKGILADRDEFRQILEQVKAFLERLREAEPDCRPRMIRLAAKCGYDGDKSPCSLDAAWMLLEEMAAKYQIAGSSPGGRPAGGWPVDTDAFKDSNRDVKNQGAGKSLRGRIFTISMFLTEASGNPWTDEARREIKEKSGKVKNWLQVQASRYKTEKNDSKLSFPDELWLGDDDASPLIVGEIPDHDTYANDWIENVVMRCIYGKPSADLLTELRKKYKFEGIHMVVYVNKQGRSYALPKAGTVTSPSDVLEGCIVYCRDKHGGLERSATIAHEVLHLYGAWDLYEDATALNAEQAQKAKECFPTDVMRCHSDDLSKEIVGPLTASLVGWSTKWYADWDFFKRKPKSG